MKTLIAISLLSFCLHADIAAQTQKQTETAAPKTGSAGQVEQTPLVEYLNPGGGRGFPFSDAVRVGEWLILSGQIGMDSSGKLAEGGIRAETKQTLENIRRVLETHGSSLDEVTKCTVMLVDMKEWPVMNEVYRTYFKPDRLPARSALGVSGLALGSRVEIECWAVVESKTKLSKRKPRTQ